MKKNSSSQEKAAIKLSECRHDAIMLLSKACEAMTHLARLRAEHKLSNNRVNSVARELAELLKVMSTCED